MPAQERLWLHDQEGLQPGPNQPGQQDQEHTISLRERWPFHLSLENDELLAEEGIFRQKLGLAPAKVGQGLQRQRGSEWFGPLSQASRECMPAAIQEPQESSENTSHTRSFSIT